MSPLRAGVAKANITPPLGMLMSGYGSRTEGAIGVHDELYTVALYLDDGHTAAGLITADIIDTDNDGAARVRAAAAAASGIPAEQIMVACSHTHGGPQTDLWWTQAEDPLRAAYTAVLVAKMAQALAEAKRRAVPVRVGYGRQDCAIALNRRERRADGVVILGVNPAGPILPFTDVIRFDSAESAEPMAVLFSYAAHGTTLTGDNLLYTADYIGAAKRTLEQVVPTATALFVAGTSADVNPYPRGEFRHAEMHGKQLGCAAAQAALAVERLADDARIAVARREFALEVESAPTLDEARAQLAEARAAVEAVLAKARAAAGDAPVDEHKAVDWFLQRRLRNAEALVEALARGETSFAIPLEAQALAIGDVAIVGLPGEIFVEIGRAVMERSPFPKTIAISHANGSAGYIPTADQVPLGGYEIERARAHRFGLPILPESDQIAIAAALAAAEEAWRKVR